MATEYHGAQFGGASMMQEYHGAEYHGAKQNKWITAWVLLFDQVCNEKQLLFCTERN